jgi:hypothetical protein
LRTPEGVRGVWNLLAAHAILEEEKQQHLDVVTDRPSLGEDEAKGYKFVDNAISPADREHMLKLNRTVFARKCLYNIDKKTEKLNRGEPTHWEDGPRRVVYKLTLRHFEELCAVTVLHRDHPPKDIEPFNVLLGLVWAWELEPDDIACIVRIGKNSGMAIGTGPPAEFEGVEQWKNDAPQMWHTDTNPLDEPMIATFFPLGPADTNETTGLRKSTQFLDCDHARYPSLSPGDKKDRRAYLREVWEKIKRVPAVGSEGEFQNYSQQGQFREVLSDGLTYVVFSSTGTSTVYFSTGHIHRGGPTLVHSFGIFLAWKKDSDDIYSDGLPVSVENYREELQGSSDDEVECLSSYEELISQEETDIIKKFEKNWREISDCHVYSEANIFGEPTAGTLSKITQAIVRHVGITKTDKCGDWGAGQGKFFYGFLNYFSPVRDLKGFGVEKDDNVWAALQAILKKQPLPNVEWLHERSENVTDWKGVTIVYNYDGPAKNDVELYHKQIMLKLFRLKTLKCLFSTKLNKKTFEYTFADEDDFNIIKNQWALVRMPKLHFGSKNPIQVGLCCHCSHYQHCNHRMVCCCHRHDLLPNLNCYHCCQCIYVGTVVVLIVVFHKKVIIVILVFHVIKSFLRSLLLLLLSGLFMGEKNGPALSCQRCSCYMYC